jgi:hypothetical protein
MNTKLIEQFPATLRPIIQQGFLTREFEQALKSRAGFRLCADRIETAVEPGGSGEDTPDNEIAAFDVNHCAATSDLAVVTARAGIASQFLQNAYTNGERAARSLDELARNALCRGFEADPDSVFRVNRRSETAELLAGDLLTMQALLDGVAELLNAGAPQADGAFNCYLDPVSARQLFSDPDFRSLFQGATSINQVFRKGMVNDLLGVRFLPTTALLVDIHPTLAPLSIRKVYLCGAGALVEADYAGMLADDFRPANAITELVDGIAMVTRAPVDRAQQIVAQSWYWCGGFAPRMRLDGRFRRAVCVEHVA